MSNRGSWTKYGGARTGNEAIFKTKDWFCQCCGERKGKDDIVFSYDWVDEKLRVCEDCAFDDCQKLQTKR